MAVLVLCLFAAFAAGLVATHARLSLPTAPEALAEQRELIAATAAEDMDVEGDEVTHRMSSSALAQALHANAGGTEQGDDDPEARRERCGQSLGLS